MTPVEWFLVFFALMLIVGLCRAIDDSRAESPAPPVSVDATEAPKRVLTIGDRKTTLGKLLWCIGFGGCIALFFYSLFVLITTWGNLPSRQRATWILNASYCYYFLCFVFSRRVPSWVEFALMPLIAILWMIITIT